LKTCPNIGPDVIACQQTYGKKILISLGGGYPTSYYLKSDDSGRALADFLWKAWGPVQSGYTGPRPWGNAVVDGFDFDIENIISPAPSANTNYQTSGYVAMVIYMKNTLFSQDTSKKYYLSGAPQCVLPDAHFTNIINNAWFDFLFIQFYNTQQCSARAGITKQDQGGKPTDDITYGNWTLAKSLNTNIKMYIGLPAAPKAAIADSYYLNLAELQRTVQRFYSNGKFGGVMLWEATYAMGNSICNKEYISWTKNILNAVAAGQTLSTTCPTTTSSISSTTKPSTTSSKTTTTPSRAARAATSSGKKRAARDEPTVHTFRTVVLPEITATPDREAESIA
jgi:chitinase